MTKPIALVALFALAIAGCGRRTVETYADLPSIAGFRNPDAAPAAIRSAARAVVKIGYVTGGGGTGSFVSADGLFLTNHHVLGNDKQPCAREGCYIKIHLDYQWGSDPKEPLLLFAEPRYGSIALDAAVFQLWDDAGKTKKFVAPHHLTIRPATREALLASPAIHMVGHPHGSLKKWTSGRAYGGRGAEWLATTIPGLAGNSGSPYLDDEGRLVGIHHHGEEKYGRRDIQFRALGTAAAALVPIVGAAPHLDDFHSVLGRHEAREIVEFHLAYLAAHRGVGTLPDGREIAVPTLVGRMCDAVIAKAYRSIEFLEEDRHWCSDAALWLNCSSPDDGRGYKFCPTGAARDEWRDRFARFAEKIRAAHADNFLSTLVLAASLETSAERVHAAHRRLVAEYLAAHRPHLDFELASVLLSADGPRAVFAGKSLGDFVLGYASQPHYEFEYDAIIQGHATLYAAGALGAEAIGAAYRRMAADPKIDLHARLLLEQTAYEQRVLR